MTAITFPIPNERTYVPAYEALAARIAELEAELAFANVLLAQADAVIETLTASPTCWKCERDASETVHLCEHHYEELY